VIIAAVVHVRAVSYTKVRGMCGFHLLGDGVDRSSLRLALPHVKR